MIDRTGMTYGKWTVLKCLGYIHGPGHLWWLCRCECGTERAIPVDNLVRGLSKQCRECNQKNAFRVSNTLRARRRAAMPPEYAIWQYLKWYSRITPRWRKFEAFRADMGPRPKGACLRRRDENRPHGPKNSYWRFPVDAMPAKLRRRLHAPSTRRKAVKEAVETYNVSLSDLGRELGMSFQAIQCHLAKARRDEVHRRNP